MRLLVTGATGFIGQYVCTQAVKQGLTVTAALRTPGKLPGGVGSVLVGEINGLTDWNHALMGVDTIIHLAARAHVMRENANNALAEFRKVNVAGTEKLARAALRNGVKRLIYVSTIGVNGSHTILGQAFSEDDHPNPQNAYALSKWEAEQSLMLICMETGLEVVVIRPPLVYGAGAPGNFALMLKAIVRGFPLPLASVNNLRSLVYVNNLAEVLTLCATHPAAAGKTYLVSDGDDISTTELLRQLGGALGHRPRLFQCPSGLLKLAGRIIGKADQVERLLGSLRVDSSKIRRELGWHPSFSTQEGLKKTGATILQNWEIKNEV